MKHPNIEYDQTGDETLMDGLARHRPEALQKLHERYYKMLHAIVMQVVHDETDAEEVLQDVFVQLWQRADKYVADKGKPLGWLITLSRRRAIDRVRQRMAYRRATEKYEEHCGGGASGNAPRRRGERSVDIADLRTYLESVIARLPPFQKDVIEDTFFRGMSQREIASRSRVPLGTVKTRIELGLRKLSVAVCATRSKVG